MWLQENNYGRDFENLPAEMLAERLRVFFTTTRTKEGKTYSRSSMVNLWSGLNRYLQNPPHNRIVNLMDNKVFQNANKVFTGQLKKNRNEGLDVS